MPINIPSDLPAKAALEKENIFVKTEDDASVQEIRPLKIAIVNLMPTKIATEIQFLRLLGNTPLQVDITLVRAEDHISKNTSAEHLDRFYTTFSQIRHEKFDGMIITGAPVEQLDFEQVDYWEELCQIMDFTLTNVFSTLYICWGAQAGLYHLYGVRKELLEKKIFGVFEHDVQDPTNPLFRGFDDRFFIPHSRYCIFNRQDVESNPNLVITSESPESGIAIVEAPENRQIFITGHFEYDADTLSKEYFRDVDKGLPIEVPKNYFQNNDPAQPPLMSWRAHAHLLFSNWLNYCVYQETPYEIERIHGGKK